MKRRYLPAAAYPEYNNAYDKFLIQSQILSGGNQSNINITTILWDKSSLISNLLKLKGDKDGNYLKEKVKMKAVLPFLEIQLTSIESEFQPYIKARLNQGYRKPEKMPAHILSKKYHLEARKDIVLAEIEELEKKLAEIEAEVQKEDDSNVLAWGLKLAGHFHGTKHPDSTMWSTLAELDGQKIGRNSEGSLIIDDPRSPYDGLSVEAYRILAAEWQASIRKADAEKLKRMQEDALSQGLPMPKHYSRGTRKVTKSTLPPFPPNERNWKVFPKVESVKS